MINRDELIKGLSVSLGQKLSTRQIAQVADKLIELNRRPAQSDVEKISNAVAGREHLITESIDIDDIITLLDQAGGK